VSYRARRLHSLGDPALSELLSRLDMNGVTAGEIVAFLSPWNCSAVRSMAAAISSLLRVSLGMAIVVDPVCNVQPGLVVDALTSSTTTDGSVAVNDMTHFWCTLQSFEVTRLD
jgi:hypothetical protein